MKAKLVVVGGDAKAAEVKLKLPTVIGRGREVTLTLPHPLVSRRHCEVFERDGKLMVRDLGSLNGTFVGNEKVSEAQLPAGELLTIGTVTFRAVYDDEPDLRPPDAQEDVPSELAVGPEPAANGSQPTVPAPQPSISDQLPPAAVAPEGPAGSGQSEEPAESEDSGDVNQFLRKLSS